MINCLMDDLPTEWNGYELNTHHAIGIQIYQILESEELNEFEKENQIVKLLFLNDVPNNYKECVEWFMNNWNHDKSTVKKRDKRILDFDVDQWRIYSDFLAIYGIDMLHTELHFWQFMGLLWNMPYKQSSFLQVVAIREKKITSKMDREERKQLEEAQKTYDLGSTIAKTLTIEQEDKIDRFDKKFRKEVKDG